MERFMLEAQTTATDHFHFCCSLASAAWRAASRSARCFASISCGDDWAGAFWGARVRVM